MKEDITSFCLDDNEDFAFSLEMAGISYCDGTYKIKRENSPFYVFEYILKGSGTVKIGTSEFEPVEGDIYMLRRGSSHEYRSDDKNPWTKIWFNAKGPLIDHLMEAYKLTNVCHIQHCDMGKLFYKMLEVAQTNNISTKEIFERAAIVLHELIMNIASRLKVEKRVQNNEALRIKQYLDQHIEDKVVLEELGNLIYRSRSQTIRLFKSEYGVTPYDYLLNKKVEMARLLLLNTNMAIKEIAFKLRFADEHYFCNFFKSKTGLSPTMIRKNV